MLINRKLIWGLILLVIIVNGIGVFEPLLRNDDPVLYANIAKHMAVSGDWIGLFSAGQPWLDKPHFPFWISAFSFKIFGINAFAYFLPGYLFHLLGAYYTYRLAKLLYNAEIGLIALLIYLSSVHLMLSGSFDVRAEAYLLGQIMPACYYWLLYDRSSSWKPLVLASFFTALAMMTKGLFVVVTIFSGLVFTWIYTKQYARIISPKWLLAYALSLLFILPELICLYLQFDAQPATMVFGHKNISGLSWYFWGSQFGRFFNSGPIVNTHGNPLFFVHTYLWAFLPWSLVFIAASYMAIRHFKANTAVDKAKLVYLLASFWLTFIMFSATKFQLDHYTNIIMPFAAILCASYLNRKFELKRIAQFQFGLSGLILLLNIGITLYLFNSSWLILFALVPGSLLIWMFKPQQFSYLERSLVFPSLAISAFFGLALLVNFAICRTYDVGYNLAAQINAKPLAQTYDLHTGWLPLEFYTQGQFSHVENGADLPSTGAYYVAMKQAAWQNNQYQLNLQQFALETTFCGNTIDRVIPYYADKNQLATHLECFVVVKHVN